MAYKPVVAIFGTNGFLGKPTINALTSDQFKSNFSLPIRALTRGDSKSENETVKNYKIDDKDSKSFDDALSGVDVVINLTGAKAALEPILDAIKRNGNIKLYIPSQFGTDLEATDAIFPNFLALKTEHSKKARDLGVKVVDIITSLFAAKGAFLYEYIGSAGYDAETKEVTYIGDENTKFNVSNLEDVGKSIAVIASKEPKELPDTVKIYSDSTSQKEVIENYEKTHNVTLKKNPNLPLDKTLKEAQDKYPEGFSDNFIYYLQVLSALGEGKGLAFTKNNEREFVNPGEKLWKWQSFP